MEKCIIVAIADNRAIGKANALLWHIAEDMKYFRQTTTGCPVIMGWMTFQSIGGKPLPKRDNVVISIFPWPDKPEESKRWAVSRRLTAWSMEIRSLSWEVVRLIVRLFRPLTSFISPMSIPQSRTPTPSSP